MIAIIRASILFFRKCYNLGVTETVGEHIDETAELNLETVKKRSIKGVLALTGRTLVLNVVSLIAQAFLWAFLSPEQFGVFWIVSAVVNFLVYFSDIGLAAALIQKRDTPNETDLKTTFTVQQILVIFLLVVLFVATPFLRTKYSLTQEGIYLLYALGISFFMSSLKSIPSILLERKLQFGKFVLPQILENLFYNLSLVFFAWNGFGIMSFTYAVLIRGVIGLITMYALSPWKPGFSLSVASLKDLLRFGVPYQLKTFVSVLKDDGMTILLGSILGPLGLGYLGMARRWSQLPLRFFMDNVTKVTFPAFARMQDDKDHLKRTITRSIFFITFLAFPAIVGLVVISPLLVRVVPKYNQWIPALIPLAIISIDTVFGSFTTQLTNALDATGRIKTSFKLTIMWTVLTFVLVPVLAIKFGVIGASVAYALVGVSSVVAIIVAQKHFHFSLWEGVGKTGISAALMGVILFVLRGLLPIELYSLWILLLVGAVSYSVLVFATIGITLLDDVKKALSATFRK